MPRQTTKSEKELDRYHWIGTTMFWHKQKDERCNEKVKCETARKQTMRGTESLP